MRRIPALVSTLGSLVVLAVVAGCSGNGSVTLPTTLPSVSRSALPSASEPAASEPSASEPASEPAVTLPELPTRTVPTETQTVTQTETRTQTQTQTQTRTETETQTATVTRTETQTATVTETPSESESPTPTPTSTEVAAAAPTAEQGTTWWPWLLLVLVLLGALAWFLIRRRQTQAELQAWDDRLLAAEREASWVEDSLTTQVLERPSAAEALPIWTAAQPRLLEIDEAFHALATEAPDGARAGRVTDIRGLLRGLVEAVGADLATAPTADPDQFRARRAVIDSARRELRATLGPVESPAAAAAADGPDTGA